MPTILRVGGFRFFFFSKEGQEPPHVHVESAECYAKFWLEPVVLARSIRFRQREITRLHRLVEQHRELFLERWHEHLGG
jgi:hypothetical protein